MEISTLDNFDFFNKEVLLRVDINSPIKNKKISSKKRIDSIIETVNELKRKKAKIILIAHQGNKGKSDFISLKQHAYIINKKTKIQFINDIIGNKARWAVNNLKNGEAILLENIRFLDDEFFPSKKNNSIIKFFVPLIDVYINDAFSVCHRNQTSMVSFSRYVPSLAGRLLEKELRALEKINLKTALFVLGGAKLEENVDLVSSKSNKILTAGLLAPFCHIALGKNLGLQNKILAKEKKLLIKLKK